MTKQEEIREWINRYLTKQFIAPPESLPEDECRGEAKAILTYLDSEGVVVKKDEEFQCGYPFCPHSNGGAVTVEPLIKE
ncbi:MAG: hypothetical protein KJ954_14420 [Alphaproteobacteria bacterium]|nr:hypothetical protein [Alphaproteobacteria bacterium]